MKEMAKKREREREREKREKERRENILSGSNISSLTYCIFDT